MRILAFGDSITYGTGDSKGGWPDRLKQQLNGANLLETSKKEAEHTVFNLGIPGETSVGLLKRIENECRARVRKILVITISIGTNDSRAVDDKESYEVPIDLYESNVRQIIQIAKKYSDRILIIGLTPIIKEELDFKNYWYYNSRIKVYNSALESLAKNEGLQFVEIFNTMAKSGIEDKLIDDGLHPNDKGYEYMLETVKSYLLTMLH